jgi:hypothetical protein
MPLKPGEIAYFPDDETASAPIYENSSPPPLLAEAHLLKIAIKKMEADLQKARDRYADLLGKAILEGVQEQAGYELREIPGRKVRELDIVRLRNDWPQMIDDARKIEIQKATDKIAANDPGIGTLTTLMGKKRVDEYSIFKQGPSSWDVVPAGAP